METEGTVKRSRTILVLLDHIRFFFSLRFVSRRRDIELLRAAIPRALRPQRLKGAGYGSLYDIHHTLIEMGCMSASRRIQTTDL